MPEMLHASHPLREWMMHETTRVLRRRKGRAGGPIRAQPEAHEGAVGRRAVQPTALPGETHPGAIRTAERGRHASIPDRLSGGAAQEREVRGGGCCRAEVAGGGRGNGGGG